MQHRSQNPDRFLRRRRALALAAGVLAVTLAFTGMELPHRSRSAEPQLLCSLKSGAHRSKLLSKDLFDSRYATNRIDRIVSGALQFASSL